MSIEAVFLILYVAGRLVSWVLLVMIVIGLVQALRRHFGGHKGDW